jgi:hypothetical protein
LMASITMRIEPKRLRRPPTYVLSESIFFITVADRVQFCFKTHGRERLPYLTAPHGNAESKYTVTKHTFKLLKAWAV